MRRTSLLIATIVLLLAAAVTAAPTVLVMPAKDGTVAHLAPVWSPDGRSVAFERYPCAPSAVKDFTGTSNLHVTTLAAGAWKERELLKGADSPVWSPDSKQIACHSGGLVIVDVASGKVQRLTTDKDGNTHVPTAWAPNGRHLLYRAGATAAVIDIKAVKNVASSVGEGGAWTNASKLVAWTSGDEPSIKLIDLASGSTRTLAKDVSVAGAFVPKGDTFAYLWLRPSPARGEGLYKVDLKSGVLAKLLAIRAEEVAWSKDGAQFATASKLIPKKGAEPEMHLYVGNTKNWAFKSVSKGLVSPAEVGSAISWSPDGKSIAHAVNDGGIQIVKL